mmetsp:Transcript_19785/g.29581  ORF Transcript_19785/g.29581 Transcript_19785/m.29581 type:complete len:412 (+) Transcript_19785:33-1268(+)
MFKLVNDYGWYVATAAGVLYLTWRISQPPVNKSRGDSKRNDRHRRADMFNTNDTKRDRSSRRRRGAPIALSQTRFTASTSDPSSTSTRRFDRNAFQEELTSMMRHSVPFIADTLTTAMTISKVQNRILFVYLHAHSADTTRPFLENVLGSREISQYLGRNFVCWAGSLRDIPGSEGYFLAKEIGMRDTRESFVAVVAVLEPEGNSSQGAVIRVVAVERARAFRAPTALLAWSVGAQDAWQRINQKREMERSRVQIREEQDNEYKQALAEDEERLRRENNEKQKELEEKKEKLNAEKKKAQAAAEAKMLREKLLASLEAEPPAGAGVITVKILFPDRKSVRRRFSLLSSLEQLFAFVFSHEVHSVSGISLDPHKCQLVTRFPRKVLKSASTESLKSSGIVSDCVLCVEESFD